MNRTLGDNELQRVGRNSEAWSVGHQATSKRNGYAGYGTLIVSIISLPSRSIAGNCFSFTCPQQPGETISAKSLVSTQFFPMCDRAIEATFSSPSAVNAFATATSPNRLCCFSAVTIARRRSAFIEE